MNGVNGRNRNPYIIGRPIRRDEIFFGRESLFRFIEDNLLQNVKFILLHGQRRIGKSSVLEQISNFVKSNEFIFVQFDLQDKGQSNLNNILHNLATTIIDQIGIDGNNLQTPTEAELEQDIDSFSRFLLQNVYPEIHDKKIVLLLDEFDVANNESNDINIVEQQGFFPYLKRLLKEQDKLFIIPVIGRYLNDLPNLLNLFKDAPYQEIGLLDDISAKLMIANPAEGVLIYQREAIQEIIQLSAGHPYFTQTICFTLFQQARTSNKWTVDRDDVKNISDQAIANSDAGLLGFWQVLTIPERIIISTVAEAQKIAIAQGRKVPEEPLALLKINERNQRESLFQAWERLIENRYLSEDGRKVRVELIRRWLLQYHPIQNEIQNLQQQNENVEHLVQNLIVVANFWSQQGEQQQALQLYERALAINPNNFNIAESLAEQYLRVENFEKSLELHKQLYKADFQNYKEGYLHALSVYGHHLIIQKEYTLAKEQYKKILEIEPNRKSATERLSEIEAYEHTRSNTPIRRNSPPQLFQISGGSTLVKILAVITVFGTVGFGTYQYSIDCPPGKQKEFGLVCVADKSRISNGDRTLFPNFKNTSRDLGIKAFKQKNYKEAIKLFGQAVEAKRNDPEVLIYYNNALARDQGNPITLAVAVPADNNANFAQEMLRGIAQAQHQFNEKNGLNGRLLEIKIANDAGIPEQAKQVAVELVKEKSILGVIGHHSSESTEAALEEYNKTDIPIISPTSTSTQLHGKKNFFRSLPDDAAGGKKLAEYAFNTLKLRKVVIFSNPDSSYSDSMREEFTKTFEILGGEVLRKPQINLADTSLDMEAEVYKIIYRDEYKAEGAVLIPDTKNIDVALKIAKVNKEVVDSSKSKNRARLGLKLLGANTLYNGETLKKGGNAVEGLITLVPWFREEPQATNFAQQAEKQWGGAVSWRTATSYDATQAFIQALSANSDRITILEKLANVNLSPNDTSGDPLKFNREGERETEPVLVQIKDGKFVVVESDDHPYRKNLR
jgi:ABC-type branched-subunit amino acid transport system substrate-binding protein